MPFYGQLVVVKRNGADGPVFPFSSRECIVGSGGHCDIRVVSPSVADEHCKLVVNEKREMCLINISLDAPTILNSEPLTAGIPMKLSDGDVFRVVDGVFRFELERQQIRSNIPTLKSTSLVPAGAAINKTLPLIKGSVNGTLTGGRRSSGQKGSRNTPKTPQSAAPRLGVAYRDSPNESNKRTSTRKPISKIPTSSSFRLLTSSSKEQKSPALRGIVSRYKEAQGHSTPNCGGVKKMLVQTKEQQSPKLGGVSGLYMEQKERSSPKLDGIKQMFHEEALQQSPNLDGVSSLSAEVIVTKNGRRRRLQKAVEERHSYEVELRSKRRVRDHIVVENVSISSAADTTKTGRRRQRKPSEENEGGLELESEVPSKKARNQKRIDDDPEVAPNLASGRRRQRKPSSKESKGESLDEEREVPSKRLLNRKVQEQRSKKDDQSDPNLVEEAKKTLSVGRRQRKPLEETNKCKTSKREAEEVPTPRPVRSRKPPDFYLTYS